MLKFAALGALGYAGYKYFAKNKDRKQSGIADDARNVAAGGPLSDQATVQSAIVSPAVR